MKTRNTCIVALCVCLALVALFSVLYISECMDHECSGINCETCLQLTSISSALKQLRAALIAIAAVIVLPLAACVRLPAGRYIDNWKTPVALKVQLNA